MCVLCLFFFVVRVCIIRGGASRCKARQRCTGSGKERWWCVNVDLIAFMLSASIAQTETRMQTPTQTLHKRTHSVTRIALLCVLYCLHKRMKKHMQCPQRATPSTTPPMPPPPVTVPLRNGQVG
jgi:hypothetical protein